MEGIVESLANKTSQYIAKSMTVSFRCKSLTLLDSDYLVPKRRSSSATVVRESGILNDSTFLRGFGARYVRVSFDYDSVSK
ncbi:unnamed protein product [Onchocerca ochengi]|uniref:Kinesin motor domain-containing protein n=1 Tax=Onchocerca ochengi TaxID=42157 RepID=A0A182EAM3_ONCOC|nr:unnamed protein product [Onchocerca ochengi]